MLFSYSTDLPFRDSYVCCFSYLSSPCQVVRPPMRLTSYLPELRANNGHLVWGAAFFVSDQKIIKLVNNQVNHESKGCIKTIQELISRLLHFPICDWSVDHLDSKALSVPRIIDVFVKPYLMILLCHYINKMWEGRIRKP